MKARQLIANASYGPDQLKALGRRAFDDAWDQVAPQVSTRPLVLEAARLKLAEIVIALSKTGIQDPQHLTDAAVREMLADPTPFQP